MTAGTTQETRSSGEVLIDVEGTFDAVAARDVRARLRALPPGACAVVDFGHVREFLDVGVAIVAPELLERDHRVRVLGLRQHHRRLFRYFGVDLDVVRAEATLGDAAADVR
jgi:hypothetical protein